MFLCGGDIVTIIILVLSIVVAISKKKESAKHIAPRSYDFDADPESDVLQDIRKEEAPCRETVVDTGKDAVEQPILKEEQQRPRTAIDKKKLIIYSEIMKPKFDE